MTRVLRPAALTLAASLLSFAAPAGAAAPALQAAIEHFKPFVAAGIDQSLAGARTMRKHIAENDLAGAQQAWIAARGGWERAEVVSDEFFPDLDDAIDSWPNGKAGFHAVEARLFGAAPAGEAYQWRTVPPLAQACSVLRCRSPRRRFSFQ